ncbi:MAG: hypothetical protein LIP02_02005 [Bacteroidales bacterium]|nr:hypothetical protein [Bacteroidales bacterium]
MEGICRIPRWAIVVVAMLSVIFARIIGNHPWECGLLRVFPIGSALMAMGFVIFGYLLRDWLMRQHSPHRLLSWILLGALAVAATVAFNGPTTNLCEVQYGNSVLLCWAGAIGGSLMLLAVARVIERRFTLHAWVEAAVRDIAVGGLIILVWDWMLIEIFRRIFPNVLDIFGDVIGTHLGSIFSILILILIVRLSRRYFPLLLGQR